MPSAASPNLREAGPERGAVLHGSASNYELPSPEHYDLRLRLARQGIEPWSTDYETAALPLSYRAIGLRVDTILRELGEVLSLRASFGVVLHSSAVPTCSV